MSLGQALAIVAEFSFASGRNGPVVANAASSISTAGFEQPSLEEVRRPVS
jgi:hypothetical protein